MNAMETTSYRQGGVKWKLHTWTGHQTVLRKEGLCGRFSRVRVKSIPSTAEEQSLLQGKTWAHQQGSQTLEKYTYGIAQHMGQPLAVLVRVLGLALDVSSGGRSNAVTISQEVLPSSLGRRLLLHLTGLAGDEMGCASFLRLAPRCGLDGGCC